MRRKEKKITDIKEIEAIIQKAEVCRLGLAVDNTPYVVPVNYGYEDNCLYIHCANVGRKLDMIKQNNTVCFEMDVNAEIKEGGQSACNWSTTFRSVIGYGKAFFVEELEQKKRALGIIMRHYSDKTSFKYRIDALKNVVIIKITITSLSGKKSG
jgi:hypothetical protein